MIKIDRVFGGALDHLPGYRVWLYKITGAENSREALITGQMEDPCPLSYREWQSGLQDGTGEFLRRSYRIYGGAPKSGEYFYEIRQPQRKPE